MNKCPKCGSERLNSLIITYFNTSSYWHTTCMDCKYEFEDEGYMD